MDFRNELKYEVSETDLAVLQHRLQFLMKLDKNISREDKTYNIRSIYLDDYWNTCCRENEAGINERYKVRIRIYDKSKEFIRLEIKHKQNGYTRKESVRITEDMCRRIINGEYITWEECNHPVLYKLYLYMKTRYLHPKVIVEYDRTAFINKVGNVRVTFDKNIRASKYIECFWKKNLYAVPILPTGQHVLEIKYDELIPDYLAEALEIGKLHQTAFSKYYLSRMRIEGERNHVI